jgi:hypothetical protein
MHGQHFTAFVEEVLHQGATAVLPQHLPEHWLNALLQEAELLHQEEHPDVDDTCAGLLGAVLCLHSAQLGDPGEVKILGSTLMEYLNMYVTALAAESVSRHTDIWVEPPTLANIFADREVRCWRKPLQES